MRSSWKLAMAVLAIAFLTGTGLAQAAGATTKSSSPATATATTTASAPAPTGVACIRMAGEIVESPPQFLLFDDASSYMTMRDWLARLAKARNDKGIRAVMLEIDGTEVSWAQAQEIASAVRRLAEVKPVYAFVVEPGTHQYLIASAATEVVMEPSGCIMITGLGMELAYIRGTLDWLGIKPQMIQIGKFKGASEPLSDTKPSPEVVAMYNWLLDDLYDQLCSDIAANRRLPMQEVKDAVDAGPFSGDDALKYKLVDKLVSKIEWRSHVLEKLAVMEGQAPFLEAYGRKDKSTIDYSNPFALLGLLIKGPPREEPRDPTVALIYGDGMIMSGRNSEGLLGGKMMGSRTMVEAFEEVRKDARIKAVVFRVDSPGGSALASEEIYQAVKKCAQAKPVIVSISALGASGGYYIALGGTTILADPAAIVGSVGVVSGKLALKGLMDKIGVTTFEMTRGRNAGLLLSREWDVREENVMRRLAMKTYDSFVSRVKESRQEKIIDIDKVVQGRVFTARQAAENGLIDKVGGLKEAFQAAQDAAKLKDTYYIITLPRPRSLVDLLSGIDDEEVIAPGAAGTLSIEELLLRKLCRANRSSGALPYALNMMRIVGRENVLMAMPYYLSIKN